jgi:two-component system OmpR family response regulator
MRILVVEDDPELARQLAEVIQGAAMLAEVVSDGEEAAYLGAVEEYDAAVLDLGLPRRDGISVLGHWREQGREFPVLILTARSRWSDKLAGFGAGADDFLAKPFELDEVPLRLRALLRRRHGHAAAVLRAGPLELDTTTSRFRLDGAALALTAQEQRILAYLMHRAGELVTRIEIGEHVYARDLERDSNTVDVLIGRIRRKIGHQLIQTERGLGFRLVTVASDG